MREFAVRAWDKKNSKMIYPPGPCDSFCGPSMTFDGRTYIGGYYQDYDYMLWTGLIDKDAEKIYEGDILGGLWEGGYIAFCDTCKSFQYHALDECFSCSGDVHWDELAAEDGTLEVLGNIYENQELLTQ
ncbi:MAG: YopX family protein [bacterium]